MRKRGRKREREETYFEAKSRVFFIAVKPSSAGGFLGLTLNECG